MSQFEHEFELDTGKVFRFRTPEIADYEMAMMAAGRTGGDNAMLMSFNMQKELLKQLLVSIDGRALTSIDREKLQTLVTTEEYLGLVEVMQQFLGKSKVRRHEQVKPSGDK